jgi:hypothetical protein
MRYLVAVMVFVLLLNQLIGFAVTEKPWYERLFLTIVSAITGGGIGVLVGLIIGGIGLALMGTAIGLIGWLALGLAGFGLGALGGSIYTILANPKSYDFDFWKLLLVIVVCLTTAGTAGIMITKAYEKLASWLKRPIIKDTEVQPSVAGDA